MLLKAIIGFFLFSLIVSCGPSKPVTIFSREISKDISGDCSTKQVGNYIFANLTNESIGVVIWNNPGKMGSGNYPQGTTVSANSSQTLYDLKPGVYAFEVHRVATYGDRLLDGQFKVEVCKEKTYNYK